MFMPHGVCFLWNQSLILVHVIGDVLIALAYYSIPAALVVVAWKGRAIAIRPLLLLFGLFILFCGTGHILDIISIWKPIYWAKGFWNLGTAMTSLLTAIVLVPKVHHYVSMPQVNEQLRRQATFHREQEGLLRAVLDSITEGIVLIGEDGGIKTANTASLRILGIGKQPEGVADSLGSHPLLDAGESSQPREFEGRQIETASMEVPGYGRLHVLRDITEQRQLEVKFLHAQKLQSLGVLAGGVAHDFNNMLMAILGHASLALEEISRFHPARFNLQQVVRSSERAADLTRQLLAYAGKGRYLAQPLSLSELVNDISALIRTSIPKSVELKLRLMADLQAVEADPGQIQQIVMNLIINGAEAIGKKSGTVLVSTGLLDADEQYLKNMLFAEDLAPGRYVSLDVHDTGCGMDAETIQRIFDPFFTTKFTGRGLGLSAVVGIVRAHKGALRVYSEPGAGTAFKVLLPASPILVEPSAPPQLPEAARGSGLILVVDDEEPIRVIAKSCLEGCGYEVRTAPDGRSGVDLFRKVAPEVSLVLMDVTMPLMDGVEALEQIRAIREDVPVILSSGYSEIHAAEQFANLGHAAFIAKPYSLQQLMATVSATLKERRKSSG